MKKNMSHWTDPKENVATTDVRQKSTNKTKYKA
jgi:hypothetical protein